ncbi:MAG: SigB/SigF/SigG family RNA polymerase sigma factor [Firmicutes bacterium]|nr:SigB/SigF/SigG family RNA polymerase sigma factor [Clostridiales bacterium]MBQ2747308.1 SigB/SigF/SigG family RNA polymerase sigma factor [Bacillota bacterium]MBQ3122614.1 SigB/SigF/SigG family RNA polymerase sigma factor [Bacillota bacterium]MBQ9972858.1 SigB/SigF/SigG family RNA polymerase sigma factor [Bacillota bacterium]
MGKEELFGQYRQTGNPEIRNAIVEKYLYMVDILIRKYLNKGVEYDDLYQVGAMALVSAVERFDPDKGFEFSSFATPTILGEIKKYFRDKEWTLKVPRRQKEIALKIPTAKEELYEKLNRTPTVAEIAEHLEISEEDVIQAMESSRAYGTYSLNQTFDEAGEDGEGSILERYTAMEEAGYNRFETAELINSAIAKLSDDEKSVFRWRFLENKTQAEIAQKLGVSQMTVSRTEKTIKQKFMKEFQR